VLSHRLKLLISLVVLHFSLESAASDNQRKQSEIGSIPTDWDVLTISECATKVGSGKTPTGGALRYKENGRPFIRSQNIGWGDLRLDDLVFIDEHTHMEFSNSELMLGDVLLNITGASIGRSAIADARLVGGNVNQHVCIIRSTDCDSRLINHNIISRLGQSQIDSFQAGGNREGLNFTQVRSIKLAIPRNKFEQRAIADVLGDMDAAIELVETKLAKARQIKQAMMQELLTGRIRLM
jgi:type I restriction enzyme S subunit